MSHHENQDLKWYEKLNHKIEDKMQFLVWIFVAAAIGGLIEIPPFFLMGEVKGPVSITPYNALELAGRDVYQQEGCFYCHTQMIRPFKWETDRWDRNREYGSEPYSKAYEYVYEHPFLFGSKRTGPDLWHENSLNNNASWHKQHLINPQETSPGSIMPAYAHLFNTPVDIEQIKANMNALRKIGVPYTDDDIAKADQLLQGKTEGDALVAYLLKLGRDAKQK